MKTKQQEVEKKLAQAQSDVEQIDILNDYSERLLNPDVEYSMQLAESARERSVRINYKCGTAKALNMLAAGWYRLTDNEHALQHSTEAQQICEEIGDRNGASFALNTIGAVSRNRGDNARALDSFLKSLALRKEIDNKVGIATSLMNIGNVYQTLGDNAQALDYFLESLELREKIGDKSGIGTSLTNIGDIYAALGQYDKALSYLQKSLKIKEEIGNRQGLILTLSSIADVSIAKGDAAASFEYAHKCYELSLRIRNKIGQANALHAIGKALERLQDHSNALAYYEKSLALHRKIDNPSGEGCTLKSIGNLLAEEGFLDQALEYLSQALSIGERYQLKVMECESHRSLASTYERKGDYAKAHGCLKAFFQMKEELISEELHRKTNNLEMIHKVEQAEKEAAITRKQNEELNKLNQRLLELNREKDEFLGIAAHDLKNPLAGILIAASTVKNYHHKMQKSDFVDQMVSIEKTARRMSDIISKLLDINAIESGSMVLKKQEFDISTMISYILTDFHDRAITKGIRIDFIRPDEAIDIYSDSSAVIEIVENLVSNALKFSPRETTVTVRLSRLKFTMQLEVIDQGPGLTKEDRKQLFRKFAKLSAQPTGGEHSTGLGLSIVKRLVDALEGLVECKSEPGNGANFIVKLPIGSAPPLDLDTL